MKQVYTKQNQLSKVDRYHHISSTPLRENAIEREHMGRAAKGPQQTAKAAVRPPLEWRIGPPKSPVVQNPKRRPRTALWLE